MYYIYFRIGKILGGGGNANFKCDNQGVRYLSEWMSLI